MTLPTEVILKALECCRDIYPHEDDVLINRDIDGYTILAIEGTKETTDWLTNIKFVLKSDDCHRGFKTNSYRSLSKLVCDYEALDKKRKLVIAGHSLGGATATLIADLILPNNPNIALVTAGSPRPGGRKLKERLKNVEHLRLYTVMILFQRLLLGSLDMFILINLYNWRMTMTPDLMESQTITWGLM